MKETIYTIPINEAFEKRDGCPFCRLYADMDAREVDIATGAAMMEPDIRIMTNRQGFCARHLDAMAGMSARLPLALMLQSHLHELVSGLDRAAPARSPKSAGETGAALSRTLGGCYICSRVDGFFGKLMSNMFTIYAREPAFRELFSQQPHFCLPHLAVMLERAAAELGKRDAQDFAQALWALERPYLEKLSADVDYFTKKFDYRYRDAPWNDSKDAVERAIATLTGRPYTPGDQSLESR